MDSLLKKVTGASKVLVFNHLVRRHKVDTFLYPTETLTPKGPAEGVSVLPGVRGPVFGAHIDLSYDAARRDVIYRLPDEADSLLKSRYQIIHVWRPTKVILRDPLAIADSRSVLDEELIPGPLVYKDRESATFIVRPPSEGRTDGGHKWHYQFNQTPEEVIIFKCFYSKTDGRARRVPHSAFVDDEFADEPTRESIEIRAMAFHPDDTKYAQWIWGCLPLKTGWCH